VATQAGTPTKTAAIQPRLGRVLTLWDLIFYGIVLIQPVAPIPLFGIVQVLSRGHIVDTIILAMFAMVITALSYGRMASLFPSAGSAYIYVGRGLNPHLGFLAGWAMFLDYLLQPILMAVWVGVAIHRLLPRIPYIVVVFIFLSLIVLLNLKGVRATARATQILLAGMFIVIGAFFVLAVRFIVGAAGWSGIFSTLPFYDPKTFNLPAIGTATSLAALTYIGFDGVTTLAEDVENPKRNVLLATVLVCVLTGLFSVLEVYLGQRVWPDYRTFPNPETAFWDVCRRAGGMALFGSITAVTLVACFGSALTGTLGAARLLFGMGRDDVLPRRIFGYLSPTKNNPTYNICLIGLLAFVASLFIDFERAAELLNFGAFLAFMGVNLATFRQFYVVGQPGRRRRFLADGLLPLLGFFFSFWIWYGLQGPAKLVGGIWLALGLIYSAVKTRGFRERPVQINFSDA
jgi:putrescine importer